MSPQPRQFGGSLPAGAGPCIEWPGGRNTDGYGWRKYKGAKWRAHRAAWDEQVGPIPDGMWVLHACDNPPCVNVSHLWLGTASDNARDREAKGRGYKPKGTCKHGHALTEENVYRRPDGRTECMECRQINLRRWRANHS